MRQTQQGNGFTRRCQGSQYWNQQADFAATLLRPQQFGQGRRWPTAAGQFLIQLRITGRPAAYTITAHRIPAPQGMW